MRTSEPWNRVPSSSRPAVHTQPNAHQSRGAHEWSRWPYPSSSMRSSAEEDLAVDDAWHLVAGGPGVVVRLAVGLPLEVEAHRHEVAARPAGPVQLGGIVDGHAGGLVGELPTIERVGADVLGPQTMAADLERRRLRQGHLLVDDRHRRAPGTADHGVVPAGPRPRPGGTEVRVQPDADPAADRAVGRAEVEVPRLAPQLLRPRVVAALVGLRHRGAIRHGLGHGGRR